MGGGGFCTKFGTHNGIRNQEPSETNGGPLQAASPGKIPGPAGLVEEFILEFEGDRKNLDVTRWDQFTDIKDIKKEMLKRLEAHFEKWLDP
jgi:hypothetical protein